jgi:tight adherence protein C
MDPQTLVTLTSVFVSVSFLVFVVGSALVSRTKTGQRRLEEIMQPRMSSVLVAPKIALADPKSPLAERLVNVLPTSFGSVARLQRELSLAGFHRPWGAVSFSVAELVCPVLLALPPIFLLSGAGRWVAAAIGAFLGYLGPSMWLRSRVARRQKEIRNGLADVLDLLVLCLEAGSGLDQAIVKAGDELGIAYPALGDQLRIMIVEMRAGKARLDAFRGLADRTRVEDVKALVSMLVQTDRFGTSIAQALRTHAEVCRTKRRQRAEEKAQKVGVKLVFPLVFCLFPALYVVLLGPAYIKFMEVFSN